MLTLFRVICRKNIYSKCFSVSTPVPNNNIPSKQTMKLIAEMVVLRSNSLDITFLIRLFKTIQSNPTARTVILARITKRLGDDLKWFVKWLWDAQKGKINDIEIVIADKQNKNLNNEISIKLKRSIESVVRLKKFYSLEKVKNVCSGDGENSLNIESETLLKLIVSFVPIPVIKDLVLLIDDYAKEVIDSIKFQDKLNFIQKQ